ncbi:MAG: sensor histidine kinase [Bradymonadia bacterium]
MSKLSPSKWSLRRQMLTALTLITAILVLLLGVAAERHERERLESKMDSQSFDRLFFLGTALTDAIAAEDSALMGALLDRFGARDPSVISVSVEDPEKRVLSIWSRPVDAEMVVGAELTHTVKLDSNIVGRLRLKQDRQYLIAEVSQRVFEVRMVLASALFVVAVIVGILIYRVNTTLRNAFAQDRFAQIYTRSDGKLLDANDLAGRILDNWGLKIGDSVSGPLNDIFESNDTIFTEVVVGQQTFSAHAVQIPEFDSVFIYFRDTTERNVLLKLTEQNPNPVLKVAQTGVINYANGASKDLLELWETSVGGAVPEHVRAALPSTEEPKRITVHVQNSVYELDLEFVPALSYINIYANDMTHLIELEDARANLIQKEKLAVLGRLVAGVAHELNTPIGVSLNAADVLADEAIDLKAKFESGQLRKSTFADGVERLIEAASLVRSNATRAAELIKSFKGVAVDQANSGVRHIQLKPYLQQVLTSLGPYTKREKLTVDVVGPDVGMHISAGPLSQVVTNLVQNAAVHAYQGQGGHVDIIINLNRPEWVDLTIRDRGVGIPEEALSRVFEPLYTTRFGSGGSGLGLHICYQTVSELLHGTITLESRLGEGTEFMIQLPINRQNLMLVDDASNADHLAV